MTEAELKQKLSETSSFQQRQWLLKQLWKLDQRTEDRLVEEVREAQTSLPSKKSAEPNEAEALTV